MDESTVGVTQALQSSYDEQYTDEMTAWRELCAKYKAANIRAVCQGRSFETVLDCGAGEGSVLKFLDESGVFSDLYAIDVSDSGVGRIRQRSIPSLKEVKKFDGYKIPYPDKFFDLAYCTHVVEHVEYPRVLLRELKRVSHFQVFEVPLDYSMHVDRKVEHFLSYGHINIYTPSLFKFLLKSEGYEILSDTLTRPSEEVTRFNWYQQQKLDKTLKRELLLRLSPVRKVLKRLVMGKGKYDEYGHTAYTCLAEGAGTLKIF